MFLPVEIRFPDPDPDLTVRVVRLHTRLLTARFPVEGLSFGLCPTMIPCSCIVICSLKDVYETLP